MITELAPAKINLYLRVCGKTPNGLHDLDSVVVFSRFGDHITLSAAPQDSFSINGPFAAQLGDMMDNNLVLKARDAFRAAGGTLPPIAISLGKHIPVGAGLGGGSADAAALLRAANQVADHPVDADTLFSIAVTLGSDVPVCLASTPHHITGVGDVITQLDTITVGGLVLVNPRIPLSTAAVFNIVTPPYSDPIATPLPSDAATLCDFGNDLLPAALKILPEIADIVAQLRANPACRAAQMSGSGASCFGIFDTADAAQRAASVFCSSGLWAVSTLLRP